MFILDEFHAMKSWGLYNVMISSQGMRTQPLAIVITTAGFLGAGYPLYDMRETCIDILKGNKEDDTQFSALYELDKDDDWKDENTWIKSCPSLGVTVSYDYLREQVQSAINTPSLQVGVITKNFNRFVSTAEVWLPDEIVNKSMQRIDIEQLSDEELMYIGIDLSSRGDLTSWAAYWPPNKDRAYYPDKHLFKVYTYIPDETYSKGEHAELYKEFVRNGYAKLTSGNVIDYDEILNDIIKFNERHLIQTIAYDNYNARHFIPNAVAHGFLTEPFNQGLGCFNGPTKDFELDMMRGDVIIDYNPIVRWMFGNAELKYDHNNNIKPVKRNKVYKIDGVIAMLQAYGTHQMKEKPQDTNIIFG